MFTLLGSGKNVLQTRQTTSLHRAGILFYALDQQNVEFSHSTFLKVFRLIVSLFNTVLAIKLNLSTEQVICEKAFYANAVIIIIIIAIFIMAFIKCEH